MMIKQTQQQQLLTNHLIHSFFSFFLFHIASSPASRCRPILLLLLLALEPIKSLLLQLKRLRRSEQLQSPSSAQLRRVSTTEISKRLKDPVLINEYMGWSQRGNTRQRYQHYYANDSVEAMLVADGLLPANNSPGNNGKRDLLKPKQCPNCDESNKPQAKFCAKCKFILSFDAYNEKIEGETESIKKQLKQLQKDQKEAQESFEEFLVFFKKTLGVDVVEAVKKDLMVETLKWK